MFFAVLFLSIPSFAQIATSEELAVPSCGKIEAACKAAGFFVGGIKEKKGLFSDCYNPVVNGAKVAKVTVDAKDITTCLNYRVEKFVAQKANSTNKSGKTDKKK